jgi:pentatricopeptide repeat protein
VHDQLLGPDNRQTVNAQARLGYILERTGDREAAERIYRETLAWRIKNLDEADPSLAGGKASLARCLARRGELHEAVRLFDEAMRIREQVVARMIRI